MKTFVNGIETPVEKLVWASQTNPFTHIISHGKKLKVRHMKKVGIGMNTDEIHYTV